MKSLITLLILPGGLTGVIHCVQNVQLPVSSALFSSPVPALGAVPRRMSLLPSITKAQLPHRSPAIAVNSVCSSLFRLP